MPLLAVGQPDRRSNLGTRQVLKALEVLLRIRCVARTLQRARQRKLRRSVQRADFQCLLQHRNRLVVLLHLLIGGALKVIRVHVPGIELHRLLKTGQCRVQFIVGVLRQSQVVPGLGTPRV